MMMLAGCRRDESAASKPAADPTPALPIVAEPSDARDTRDEDDPELIEQLPIPASPLAFGLGVGGGIDLDVSGLPAIRADGERIARVERGMGSDGQRRLALHVLSVPSGDLVREHVILDPARDISRGKLPSQTVMDRRLAAANAALGSARWMSLIEPESVLPDGVIRCRSGSQDFEVAGLLVSYSEPTLTIKRGDLTLFSEAMAGWVARTSAPGCQARSFIADAALDLRHGPDVGRLLVDLRYCGDCSVKPRVAVVSWSRSDSD
jgi:hypothetical protein